jgi:hypothetical protein
MEGEEGGRDKLKGGPEGDVFGRKVGGGERSRGRSRGS